MTNIKHVNMCVVYYNIIQDYTNCQVAGGGKQNLELPMNFPDAAAHFGNVDIS